MACIKKVGGGGGATICRVREEKYDVSPVERELSKKHRQLREKRDAIRWPGKRLNTSDQKSTDKCRAPHALPKEVIGNLCRWGDPSG